MRTDPMNVVVLPASLVDRAFDPPVGAFSVFQPVLVLARVLTSLMLLRSIREDLFATPMLEAISPLACISCVPHRGSAKSVALAVRPLTHVGFARRVCNLSSRVGLAVDPLAFEGRSIDPAHGAIAVPEPAKPVTLVNCARALVRVLLIVADTLSL